MLLLSTLWNEMTNSNSVICMSIQLVGAGVWTQEVLSSTWYTQQLYDGPLTIEWVGAGICVWRSASIPKRSRAPNLSMGWAAKSRLDRLEKEFKMRSVVLTVVGAKGLALSSSLGGRHASLWLRLFRRQGSGAQECFLSDLGVIVWQGDQPSFPLFCTFQFTQRNNIVSSAVAPACAAVLAARRRKRSRWERRICADMFQLHLSSSPRPLLPAAP